MITEDYVSFEVAKLLKEKRFDENCTKVYINKELRDVITKESIKECTNCFNHYLYPGDATAPTLQMAMKWFRKEKGIAIIPIPSSVLDNEEFLWDVEIIVAKTNKTYYQGWVYKQYEEAVEAAIKYCLTNLI